MEITPSRADLRLDFYFIYVIIFVQECHWALVAIRDQVRNGGTQCINIPYGQADDVGQPLCYMKKGISLKECFDASSTAKRLARARCGLGATIGGLIAFLALAITLYCLYAYDKLPHPTVGLVFGVIATALAFLSLAGVIVCAVISANVLDHASQCASIIEAEAAKKAETYREQIFRDNDIKEPYIVAEGYYFNDIDQSFLQRRIDSTDYSSNYQVSVVYTENKCLCYAAKAFGLMDNQEHTMCGSIPYGRITTIEIIKPNGIDLFCSQLKIAFANRCLLFPIDASDNRVKVENLRNLVLAEE